MSRRKRSYFDANRVPLITIALFTVVWVVCAIKPNDFRAWLLENLLTFVFVPTLIFTYRRFRFSDRAYIQLALFMTLHTIGSHYTYSLVPFGEWLQEALGTERNHYDRIVHFAFGLLLLCPLVEIVLRMGHGLGPIATAFVSVAIVSFFSHIYEVMEWVVAIVADPSSGIAYLGTQGDQWDAQKDMTLAVIGACIATSFESWKRPRRRKQAT